MKPPKPEDFGLRPGEAPDEGFEASVFGIPRRLSVDANWNLGLATGVPLGVWTLWGIIQRIDTLALGLTVGLLVGVVVFQMAIFSVPLMVDVTLFLTALLSDEFGALFSERARRRQRYRQAWRQYRRGLARGEDRL